MDAHLRLMDDDTRQDGFERGIAVNWAYHE